MRGIRVRVFARSGGSVYSWDMRRLCVVVVVGSMFRDISTSERALSAACFLFVEGRRSRVFLVFEPARRHNLAASRPTHGLLSLAADPLTAKILWVSFSNSVFVRPSKQGKWGFVRDRRAVRKRELCLLCPIKMHQQWKHIFLDRPTETRVIDGSTPLCGTSPKNWDTFLGTTCLSHIWEGRRSVSVRSVPHRGVNRVNHG